MLPSQSGTLTIANNYVVIGQGPISAGELPTSVPGLQGWWRGDLGISINGSNQITSWADQSGNNYTVSPQVNTPTYSSSGGANNLPYLSWPGGASQAGVGLFSSVFPALSQPLSAFIVLRPTQGASTYATNYYTLDFGGGNKNVTEIFQGTSPLTIAQYDGSSVDYNSVIVGTDYVIESQFNGASSNVLINNVAGTAANPGNTSTGGGIAIGSYYLNVSSNYCFVGYIYEVMVFNSIISSANRANIYNYLQSRYYV